MSALRVSIVTNAKEETAAFTSGIFPNDMEILLQTESEMLDQIGNIDVLIPGHISVGKDLIEQGQNLKLIHCGTGYNNVDLDAASAQGALCCCDAQCGRNVGRRIGVREHPDAC